MKLPLILIIILSAIFAQPYKSKNILQRDCAEKILTGVESIINNEETDDNIKAATDLYIVAQNKFMFFHALKSNSYKYKKIVGSGNLIFNRINIKFNKSLTNAVLILQYKNNHHQKWHTINIEKNESNQWIIIGWHISDQQV